jgi:HTH-type transcriptional regulator/antitoxin HigA
MENRVGKALQEGLDAAGVPQALLARRAGISTKHINQLVKGNARLSVDVAVRIEAVVPSISCEELLMAQVRQEIADYGKAE